MSEDRSTDKLAALLQRFKEQRAGDSGTAGEAPEAETSIPRHDAILSTVAGAAAGEPVPASYAQQRLWLLDRLEPGSTAYNMPFPARLRGELPVRALHRSLREMLRRHGSLRTSFAVHDRLPVQRVEPFAAQRWPLPVVDLSALPEKARGELAEELVDREANTAFDLEAGPVYRMRLLRLEPRHHVLLQTMHHIVSDGWSIGVCFRELAQLLAAFAAGEASPLPELPIQYTDFTLWQRKRLQGELLEQQLSYWRQQLAPGPGTREIPTLELPLDRPRPAVQSHRGGTVQALLPTSLAASLRGLGRHHGASLFMVLLAAFKVLMHRYSGQSDVIVGTPTAGRDRLEVEGLVGLFLNSLALRTDLSGNPPFAELVQRVRTTALGAAAHQEVPFERLLEELQPERHLSHSPIFQVFFNMINLPDYRFELPGLEVEILSPPTEGSKFDLTLYAEDAAAGLRLDLVYDADLFERPRMEEMLRQYRRVLEQVVAEPGRPVDELSLVTEHAETLLPDPAASLSEAWNGSLPAGFDRRAEEAPEHPAVIDPRDTWSYGELRRASDGLARWLVSCALERAPEEALEGVLEGAPGEPTGGLAARGIAEVPTVAIYAQRNASLVWALLGILKAGGAFVVLDPAHPPARQAEYARLARPRALIEIEGAPEPPPELLAALEGSSRARLRLPRRAGLASFLAGPLGGAPEGPPPVAIRPETPAYVAFTSGSTGEPKGVVGRHGSLTHFLPWLQGTFGFDRDDRHSLLSALAHDPLHRDVFMPLWFGATIVVPDPEQIGAPGWLARWAKREGLTVLNLVPAMLQLLTQPLASGERVEPLDELRYVFTVGDVLTRRAVAELYHLSPSATCVNYYGSTETQRSVSYFVLDREHTLASSGASDGSQAHAHEKAALPLGRGIEGVQLLVLATGDAQAPRRCGVGEIGEIYFRSHHMALGYLGDPELSAKKFRTNPWTGRQGDRLYRSGDLGRYLPGGDVEFLGRADQQVKVRGYRIELQEIERALDAHPAVAASAVAVREAARGDRRLAAYVVARPGATPEPAELRAYLADRLPDYMVPAAYGVLEALPLSPTGKLDRRALPPLDELETAGGEGYVAPRNEQERTMAEIWRRWLEVDKVGVHDNFFDLGGHSLLATQVLSEMQQELEVEVPLRWLFEAPTVAGLTLAIDQHRAAAVDEEALGEMLADLEGLSEEELDALLAEDETEDETGDETGDGAES